MIIVLIFGLFSGFMSAKTSDYNTCLQAKQHHTAQYCKDNYGVVAKGK